jgi:hypothetical protein
MHVHPVSLPAGMNVTHMSFSMLPWGSPAYSGLVGDCQAEPALAVSFEWPMSWVRTVQDVPKYEREWLCLRRFSADQSLVAGVHAFADIQPGADPPDCFVMTDDGQLGVESTSLTIEDRRGVHALFRNLRRQVQVQDPRLFAKLAGTVVYVWFSDAASTGLARPYRKSDDDLILDLIRQLADYVPEPAQMWQPFGPPPAQMPELPVVDTAGGARFYALPITGSAPGSMLFTIAGFELGLAYTSLITSTKAWQIVHKLVDDHDQPGVDVLLITAGAPDQHGEIYPAEEALASFLLGNPQTLTNAPKHIKKIWLHSWSTGQAAALYPATAHLFGPIYQNLAPVHHPLVTQPPQPADDVRAEAETTTDRDADDHSDVQAATPDRGHGRRP